MCRDLFTVCLGLLLCVGGVPAAAGGELRGVVASAATGEMLAARIELQRQDDGSRHFVRSTAATEAVTYERQNWLNPNSLEKYTNVPAAPFVAEDLAAGRYLLTVERGKEYFPETVEVVMGDEPVEVRVALRRWVDLAERGWYSGETHLHRTLDELPVVLLAEDLNVALPLSYWVTKADTPPTAGDRNLGGEIPDRLIAVDATHVIWPRNTEYEIFTVGDRRHTLGALFLLNHRTVFQEGVPPWGAVADQARTEGGLLDMDKLDWPFAMTLPVTTGATLYELANNHLWRTEFAFRQWNSPAPPFLQPPYGGRSGDERQWLHYTLGMYYVLLDAGFRLVPTAGTANGVHPVPAGFSRVYVHLPDGFSYQAWIDGLAAGRSFVTTGPMLLATADGQQAGATFRQDAAPATVRVEGTVLSEHPLAMLEIVANGQVVRTLMPQNQATPAGARQSMFAAEVAIASSGWLCVRAFEDRPDGRVRFAHTAPWWVEIDGLPLRPRQEEKDYLVRRVRDEMDRSADVLPAPAMAEYERALAHYERLVPRGEEAADPRPPRDEADLRRWLENMVWHHRYRTEEISAATGLGQADLAAALSRLQISDPTRPARSADAPLRVLPYPGGRHPRRGFLDGAETPQRDTKFSVFLPWGDGSDYVVVDLPEAIWSNLGLTYLAHTHIPTLWDAQGIRLPPAEWQQADDGVLEARRELPNGIAFGARVEPDRGQVRMELWLKNGTSQPLTGLRAQVCVMLQAAAPFSAQTGTNKRIQGHAVAVLSNDRRRGLITVWEPCQRPWQNPPVPCLHSDPALPDCQPGETVRARGLLNFYEGDDIDGQLRRIAEAWQPPAQR